ncbi:hypothetical protein VYU27_010779, partial [Nannochloropsis oceanica]
MTLILSLHYPFFSLFFFVFSSCSSSSSSSFSFSSSPSFCCCGFLSSFLLSHSKLNELLDALEFNQVVIFVSKVNRANALNKLLVDCNFPSICIHGGMSMDERIQKYNSFKNWEKRLLVATDLFGRGIDIQRVNVVINYDFPT